MTRRLRPGTRLVLATHNPGKAAELRLLLVPHEIDCVAASTLGLTPPVEDGSTYEQNARLKGLAAAKTTGMPSIADDTGLAVDALDGRPGIHTRRIADERGGWPQAHAWLRAQLSDVSIDLATTSCTARFHCVLCLAWPDGYAVSYCGVWEGSVAWPAEGEGPGFVPVFRGSSTESGVQEPPPPAGVLPHRFAAFRLLAGQHLFGSR